MRPSVLQVTPSQKGWRWQATACLTPCSHVCQPQQTSSNVMAMATPSAMKWSCTVQYTPDSSATAYTGEWHRKPTEASSHSKQP
jgi:hypothetical protein